MARPLRIKMEDGLYRVTARGWERRSIVDGNRDRQDWIRLRIGCGNHRGIATNLARLQEKLIVKT